MGWGVAVRELRARKEASGGEETEQDVNWTNESERAEERWEGQGCSKAECSVHCNPMCTVHTTPAATCALTARCSSHLWDTPGPYWRLLHRVWYHGLTRQHQDKAADFQLLHKLIFHMDHICPAPGKESTHLTKPSPWQALVDPPLLDTASARRGSQSSRDGRIHIYDVRCSSTEQSLGSITLCWPTFLETASSEMKSISAGNIPSPPIPCAARNCAICWIFLPLEGLRAAAQLESWPPHPPQALSPHSLAACSQLPSLPEPPRTKQGEGQVEGLCRTSLLSILPGVALSVF